MRTAEVRLRLKSEHGRPVAPPKRDPVVTRPVYLGRRRDTNGK